MLEDFEIDQEIRSERIEKEEDLWKVDVAFSSFDLFTPPLDLLSLSSTSPDIIFPEEVKYRPYMYENCLPRPFKPTITFLTQIEVLVSI